MSDADGVGLQKLVEFLNTTRRQAELSIKTLSDRISELETEIKSRDELLASLHEENSHLNSVIAQLKLENSQKWRLQERDDWKSLVDSIQKDRSRLQDENLALTNTIETLEEKVAKLEDDLEKHREFSISSPSTSQMDSVQSLNSVVDNDMSLRFQESEPVVRVPLTPIVVRKPKDIEASSEESPRMMEITGTPHTLTRKLKLELEKAHNQMEVERRAALNEKLSQETEIQRLQNELQKYHHGGVDSRTSNLSTGHSHQNFESSSSLSAIQGSSISPSTSSFTSPASTTYAGKSSQQKGWSFPLLSLFFSRGHESTSLSSKPTILYV